MPFAPSWTLSVAKCLSSAFASLFLAVGSWRLGGTHFCRQGRVTLKSRTYQLMFTVTESVSPRYDRGLGE
jgi:hypothetical protein